MNRLNRLKRLNREQAGNFAILLALFLYTAWYLWDAWRASSQIYNLIFEIGRAHV